MKSPEPMLPARGGARIRVALVDDDPHFVLFLESALSASARHYVAATASSAEDAMKWSANVAPDVALVDIGLPGRAGSDLVSELLKKFPRLMVIMLTAQSDEEALLDSIRAGAVGYLLKGVDEQEIIAAIDDALTGGAPMSPPIARRVLTVMRQTSSKASAGREAELERLTEREREMLELVSRGAANKEVAERLGITVSTVKNTLLAIYAKWRVRSRVAAALKYRGAK